MKLSNLKYQEGSKKERKRVGRGTSSTGKTSGRGHKGQKARSGGKVRLGFEGGQTQLFRRIAKRGFTNAPFKVRYAEINVSALEQFADGTVVTPELLKELGLVKKTLAGVKVLGQGNLSKKLTVKAQQFSLTAKEKIESVGGKTEVI